MNYKKTSKAVRSVFEEAVINKRPYCLNNLSMTYYKMVEQDILGNEPMSSFTFDGYLGYRTDSNEPKIKKLIGMPCWGAYLMKSVPNPDMFIWVLPDASVCPSNVWQKFNQLLGLNRIGDWSFLNGQTCISFDLNMEASTIKFQMQVLRFMFEYYDQEFADDVLNCDDAFDLYTVYYRYVQRKLTIHNNHSPLYAVRTPEDLYSYYNQEFSKDDPTFISGGGYILSNPSVNPDLGEMNCLVRDGEFLDEQQKQEYIMTLLGTEQKDGFFSNESKRTCFDYSKVNVYTSKGSCLSYTYDGDRAHNCYGGLVRTDTYFGLADGELVDYVQVPVHPDVKEDQLTDFLQTPVAKKYLHFTELEDVQKYGFVINADNHNGVVFCLMCLARGDSYISPERLIQNIQLAADLPDFEQLFITAFPCEDSCMWEGDPYDASDETYETKCQEGTHATFRSISGYCWGYREAMAAVRDTFFRRKAQARKGEQN